MSVDLQVRVPLARITLNRPARGNALDYATVADLAATIAAATDRADVRAVVLTGAGRHFCVGGDLAGEAFSPARQAIPMAEDTAAQLERSRVVEAIRGAPQIFVAAVNGPCVGAGLGLALACDIRIASERAMFKASFLDVGVSGDYGALWSLARMIGESRARELVLLSTAVDALEAKRIGLVSVVVAESELNAAVDELAARLSAHSREAVAGVKQNFADAAAVGFAEYLPGEAERQVRTARLDFAVLAAARRLAETRTPDPRSNGATA